MLNVSLEYSFTSFFLQCGLHALLSLFVMDNPQHSILLFRSYRLCCCYLKLLVVDNLQTGAKCFVSEVEFYGLQVFASNKILCATHRSCSVIYVCNSMEIRRLGQTLLEFIL